MIDLDDTLAARTFVYGEYRTQAQIEQRLRAVLTSHNEHLEDHHEAAIGMICHKIARVLNGDPNHRDSWHDIAGYAMCVVKILDEGEMHEADTR